MPGEVQVGYWETFPLRKSSAAVAQLPGEVVESLSPEVLKNCADGARRDVGMVGMGCCWPR